MTTRLLTPHAGAGGQGRRVVIGGGQLVAAGRTMDRTAEAYPTSTNYR